MCNNDRCHYTSQIILSIRKGSYLRKNHDIRDLYVPKYIPSYRTSLAVFQQDNTRLFVAQNVQVFLTQLVTISCSLCGLSICHPRHQLNKYEIIHFCTICLLTYYCFTAAITNESMNCMIREKKSDRKYFRYTQPL